MDREYNPKYLRELDRLCVYKCNSCSRIVFLGFDAKDSNIPVTCRACGHYIDPDMDIIGDSWLTEEYTEIAFTIDEDNIGDKAKKPRLIVWFHMECRDCKQMTWIAWRGKWFDYTTCICHEPLVKEDKVVTMPTVIDHITEDVIVKELVIPEELVGKLKDYCFQNDVTKKDVLIKALRRFFVEHGDAEV